MSTQTTDEQKRDLLTLAVEAMTYALERGLVLAKSDDDALAMKAIHAITQASATACKVYEVHNLQKEVDRLKELLGEDDDQ